MRELSGSYERITHCKKETFILLNPWKKAEGAETLLKNITHLFFPTEMQSNALGDKCTEEMQ